MSSENVEVIRRVYTALNKGDAAAIRGLTHPDLVAIPPSPFVTGETGPYRGHDDVERWFEGMRRRWESFEATPLELLSREDMVLAEVELSLTPRSGATMGRRVHAVWTVEDGRVSAVSGFEYRRDALEAFGG